MNNDINFLDIELSTRYPSQILKAILDCVPQKFLDPNMCDFFHICISVWSQTLVVNW